VAWEGAPETGAGLESRGGVVEKKEKQLVLASSGHEEEGTGASHLKQQKSSKRPRKTSKRGTGKKFGGRPVGRRGWVLGGARVGEGRENVRVPHGSVK